MVKKQQKIAIIGLGKVGMTAAYALTLKGVADELVLLSHSQEKLEGEKLDLEHGLPFLENQKIITTNDYSLIQGADVVVVTAGEKQEPGQSRLDLTQANKKMIKEIGQKITPYVKESVVVVVSNPVDILTYELAKILNLPEGRVLGTGTMLDTARLRFHLSEILQINPRSIHAYVIGEHGESALATLAHATVGGQLIHKFPRYNAVKAAAAFAKTKDAASKIIKSKGATYYAIGVVLTKLIQTILQNKRSVLPVSVPIHNYHGQSDLAISVPCIVGKNGVEQVLEIALSEKEREDFIRSCEIVKEKVSL